MQDSHAYHIKDNTMPELNFNIPDPTGTSRFVSPAVKIYSDTASVDKNIFGGLALQLGYIAKAIVEKNYTLKTHAHAGAKCLVALQDTVNKASDATLTVFMPTEYTSRESDDLTQWSACTSITIADMLKAAESLAVVSTHYDAMDVTVKDLSFPDYACSQPVYYVTDTKTVSKKTGGKKPVTSLI